MLTEDDESEDLDEELELELLEEEEYDEYEEESLFYIKFYLLPWKRLFLLLLLLDLDLDLFFFFPEGSTTSLYPCIFLSFISFTAASAS